MNSILDSLPIWSGAQTLKTSNRGRGSDNQSLLGVKKLRELILELAMRGKLVPQDPNDEPASILLKKIEKEQNRLIKEGKSKKLADLPEVEENEIPFDIPIEWIWTRLGRVTTYGLAEKLEPGDVTNETWILDLEDIEKETSKLLQKVRYSEKQFQSSKNRFYPGDVIYGKLRPYLDKVIVADEIGVCTTEMIPLNGFVLINPQFLRLVMKSPYFIQYATNSTHGMNLPRLGTDKARLAYFPLPTLPEQHRIVAKVDELMALCDKLEQQQTDSNASHEMLVETLLSTLTMAECPADFDKVWRRFAAHFETLLTTEQSIDQLKQTILQLAVMGKLVPQDPNDEPASELLRKIAKEKAKLVKEGKIKKQEVLPEITEDEKLTNLPYGWTWAYMPQVISNEKYAIKRGPFGSSIRKDFFVEKGYKVYEQQNAIYDDFSLGNYYLNDLKYVELQAFEVKPNDIIISCSGTVGKVAIAPEWMERGIINQALLKVTLNENVLANDYFKILFPSFFMRTDTLSDLKGTAQKNMVSVDTLKNEPFPLPPLAEQHRIVAKVDELFALCDALKEELREAQNLQNQMAVAVVEKALI